ncbi:hypothetical protein CMO90_00780 [Candidatus Woesearchaeota archaeon]|jgi:hypothetical protein|nr:hypothetical protein [Candidatus Woesearchaeota archaeon]|tara:strand:+ start:2291 stop:2701 length:411 start_codon:yes stop_codon:yes gene_type:complete
MLEKIMRTGKSNIGKIMIVGAILIGGYKTTDLIKNPTFADFPNEKYAIIKEYIPTKTNMVTFDMLSGKDRNYTSIRSLNSKINETITGTKQPMKGEDVAYLKNIRQLDNEKGYTIKDIINIYETNPDSLRKIAIKR